MPLNTTNSYTRYLQTLVFWRKPIQKGKINKAGSTHSFDDVYCKAYRETLPFTRILKSLERLTKIATADYISSHPGGVLG